MSLALLADAAGLPSWVFLLAIVPSVAVLVIVVIFGGRANERRRANAQALAKQLDLRLEEGKAMLGIFHDAPRLSGKHQGRDMRFYAYSRQAGKSRISFVAVAIDDVRAQELTLTLSRENLFHTIGKKFGVSEIEIDVPAFDKRFFVRGSDERRVCEVLDEPTAAKIMEAWPESAPGHIELKGASLVYSERGSFYDADKVQRLAVMADVLVALARRIEGRR